MHMCELGICVCVCVPYTAQKKQVWTTLHMHMCVCAPYTAQKKQVWTTLHMHMCELGICECIGVTVSMCLHCCDRVRGCG